MISLLFSLWLHFFPLFLFAVSYLRPDLLPVVSFSPIDFPVYSAPISLLRWRMWALEGERAGYMRNDSASDKRGGKGTPLQSLSRPAAKAIRVFLWGLPPGVFVWLSYATLGNVCRRARIDCFLVTGALATWNIYWKRLGDFAFPPTSGFLPKHFLVSFLRFRSHSCLLSLRIPTWPHHLVVACTRDQSGGRKGNPKCPRLFLFLLFPAKNREKTKPEADVSPPLFQRAFSFTVLSGRRALLGKP